MQKEKETETETNLLIVRVFLLQNDHFEDAQQVVIFMYRKSYHKLPDLHAISFFLFIFCRID